MARKVKFPLKMADGAEVRTLDELKEHFDVESVVGYFSDGRLLTWLQSRYYDEEADKVAALDKEDPQIHKKLCAIFGVESEEEVDPEEIAWRQERLNTLKQYTADREIWERVDQVAFNQEDLGDLLDEDATLIYLCANRFIIPLRATDKEYVGIGKAIAVIRSKEPVDFDKLNIKFKGVRFDDDYQKILDASSKIQNNSNMARVTFIDVPSNIQINGNMARVTFRYSSHSKGIVEFTNKASLFRSDIKITVHDKTVDAKNFVKVIHLNLKDKDFVTITAVGSDAVGAVFSLKECLQF